MKMTIAENTMDFIGNFCRFVVLSFMYDRRQQQTGFRRVFFFPFAHCRFTTTKREVKIQDARDRTSCSRLPPRWTDPRTVTPSRHPDDSHPITASHSRNTSPRACPNSARPCFIRRTVVRLLEQKNTQHPLSDKNRG